MLFPLLKGETQIGRIPAEGVIAFPLDDGMSKLHAKIGVGSGDSALYLRDLSKNGSVLNGQSVHKNEVDHPLEDGSILRFGNTICMIRFEPVRPDDHKIPSLIGVSLAIRALRYNIARAAKEDRVSILLRGETGTGKEVVAKAIHLLSPRHKGPFVAVNCAAIPESLAPSEFFGNTRHAFTGANDRLGCFRAADTGSLFLDEIGDMDPKLQPQLFRALAEREVVPVGAERSIASDFRLIAATNQPLWQEGQRSDFRKELFGRIAQFQIEIPPLRSRKEDIVPLLLHFYPEASDLLTAEFVCALLSHDWPLNVRQLLNVSQQLRIEHSTVNVCAQIERLENQADSDEPNWTPHERPAKSVRKRREESASHGVPSKEQLLRLVIAEKGNVSRLAEILCCDRHSVRRYLQLHALQAEDYRETAATKSSRAPRVDLADPSLSQPAPTSLEWPGCVR